MFQRVSYQVGKHLHDAVLVGHHEYGFGWFLADEFHLVAASELEAQLDVPAEVFQVGFLFPDGYFSGFHPREVQHLVNQRLQSVVVALDDFKKFHSLLGRIRFGHDT